MTPEELLQRISPEQRALLRAVLGRGDVARGAYEEWRGLADIDHLQDESYRLLPLLARRLGDIAPEDPLRPLVRGAYRLAWVRNQLITRDAGTLAAALQHAGIPVLLLKGAALVAYYGNDWGRRPMYDVDLLVRLDQVDDALEVLSVEGWRPKDGISAEWFSSRVVPRRHSLAFSRGLDEQLDLHWHVLAESLGAHADDRFWAHRSEMELSGVKVAALSRPDLLLHLLAHGARSTSRSNVQWVADAVHVVRAADSTELAQPLAAEARRHGLLTIVRSALEAIDFLLDEPAVRPLLREVSATRRPLLERVAMSNGGAMLSPARSAAASLLRHGGGGEGVISRASGLARELLDLDHVSRPVAYSVYVASGRRPGIAALARRRWPALVRPSRVPSTVPAAGADLDFTSATTGDRHAGPGWWKLDELGLWSHGAEGRIVVDLTVDGEDDVELGIVACSYNQQPRPVQVRVNEKVVARVTVGPRDAPTELRVHVPADVAWRFRPMEIGFLAPPSGPRLRRGRVGVRVQRVRITPNGSLRETGLPAPPSGSPRGGG